ncbi:hypothetical protein QZH41_006251 [Actinostola sp. cb2023]|nr:hypothetical protein QZH41_006251 [Actinostola sp. cb2023]
MDDISVKKREIEERLKQEKMTLTFLKESLAKSDQITHNMASLRDFGRESLEKEFRMLLNRHSKPVPGNTILECIGTDEGNLGEELNVDHLSERVIEDLSTISHWLIGPGKSSSLDFMSVYAQIRSNALVRSMQGSYDFQSERELMKPIIPEEHQNQIFDNLIETAINTFISEGDTIVSTLKRFIVKHNYSTVVQAFPILKQFCQIQPLLDDVLQTLIFMDQLLPYVETVGNVLATQQEDQMGGVIYRDEGQLTRITAEYVQRVLGSLGLNLQLKAKVYESMTLSALFLLNNYHYILKALQRSGLIALLNDGEITNIEDKYQIVVEEQKNMYDKCWSKVLHYLLEMDKPGATPKYADVGAKLKDKQRQTIKDKFKGFNTEFDDIYQIQKTYAVPDQLLREEIRQKNIDLIVPLYRTFREKYEGVQFTKNPENTVSSRLIIPTTRIIDIILFSRQSHQRFTMSYYSKRSSYSGITSSYDTGTYDFGTSSFLSKSYGSSSDAYSRKYEEYSWKAKDLLTDNPFNPELEINLRDPVKEKYELISENDSLKEEESVGTDNKSEGYSSKDDSNKDYSSKKYTIDEDSTKDNTREDDSSDLSINRYSRKDYSLDNYSKRDYKDYSSKNNTGDEDSTKDNTREDDSSDLSINRYSRKDYSLDNYSKRDYKDYSSKNNTGDEDSTKDNTRVDDLSDLSISGYSKKDYSRDNYTKKDYTDYSSSKLLKEEDGDDSSGDILIKGYSRKASSRKDYSSKFNDDISNKDDTKDINMNYLYNDKTTKKESSLYDVDPSMKKISLYDGGTHAADSEKNTSVLEKNVYNFEEDDDVFVQPENEKPLCTEKETIFDDAEKQPSTKPQEKTVSDETPSSVTRDTYSRSKTKEFDSTYSIKRDTVTAINKELEHNRFEKSKENKSRHVIGLGPLRMHRQIITKYISAVPDENRYISSVNFLPDRIELRFCGVPARETKMKRCRSITDLYEITVRPQQQQQQKPRQPRQPWEETIECKQQDVAFCYDSENEILHYNKPKHEHTKEMYITQYTHHFDPDEPRTHIAGWKVGVEPNGIPHEKSRMCVVRSPVVSDSRRRVPRPKSAPPQLFGYASPDIQSQKVDVVERGNYTLPLRGNQGKEYFFQSSMDDSPTEDASSVGYEPSDDTSDSSAFFFNDPRFQSRYHYENQHKDPNFSFSKPRLIRLSAEFPGVRNLEKIRQKRQSMGSASSGGSCVGISSPRNGEYGFFVALTSGNPRKPQSRRQNRYSYT